jgi:hypothetical protein
MKENKPLKEEEKILHYLNGHLSEDDIKKIEAELDSDEFTKDALEGLIQLNQNALPATLHQINTDLKKQLRKRQKKSMKIITPSWIYITFTILIIVAIAAYFIIKMLK